MLAAIASLGTGCKSEEYPEYQYQTRLVKQAFLNSEITVFKGKEIEIQGIGFVVGDKIVFRAEDGTDYTTEIVSVDDTSALFLAPEMPQGQYTIYIPW